MATHDSIADQPSEQTNTHMIPTTVAVLTATPLCLLYAETRWMGVAGLLAYLHSLLLDAVLVAVVVITSIFHYTR